LKAQQISPRQWYESLCDKGFIARDEAQAAAVEELDVLWQQLVEFKKRRERFLGRSLLSPRVPQGLYIWGGVGRGKTFLMDGFYHCLPYRRKRRLHFHQFMSEVHLEMKKRADFSDPLIALADDIANDTRLFCLDEFHVEDIADAMILDRLLAALFERGLVLLVTSNHPPDELYLNGLQRQNFLPAIALLKREMKVLHFEGEKDYRMQKMMRDPFFLDAPEDLLRMEAMYQRLTKWEEEENVGHIPVLRATRHVAWCEFKEICGGNHDQSDYLEITRRYSTLFVSGVPRMTGENADQAKRFAWLIDVLYDARVRLVASYAAPPEILFEVKDEESQRIVSRLMQMQTRSYLEEPHRP
jgi:cell division protein ZapE